MKKYELKILYVEDEKKTRENYTEFFEIFFENVKAVESAEEALSLFEEKSYDIVISDINLVKMDGLTLVEKIREHNSDIPIIIFSAFPNQENLLKSIDTNITKFLIKPVKITELEATLKNTAAIVLKQENNILKFDCNITWNTQEQILYKDQQAIKLTKLETEFLKLLCSNPKHTFSSDDILNHLWCDNINNEYDTKSLRALIYRLKTKLQCQIIESVYKIGYKLILES